MDKKGVILISLLVVIGMFSVLFLSGINFNEIKEKITGNAISESNSEKVELSPSKNWYLCNDVENTILVGYTAGALWKRPVMKDYKDECADKNYLRDYFCENNRPYYTEIYCKNGCDEDENSCSSEPNQDDFNMEECAVNCILDNCNQIEDKNKKEIAHEQYSLNCDKNSCQDEDCAKKIAINYIAMNGKGTDEDPYQIKNCLQLESVSLDLDANYILINNIDCVNTTNWDNGKGFDSIGTFEDSESRMEESCFIGKFNGNGYIISNLFIGRPNEIGTGVFSCIYDAEINNLILINSNVNGGSVSGGLIGSIGKNSLVESSVFNGRVTGLNYAGGIAGNNYGLISDSYSSGNVMNEEKFYSSGGLVGYNYNGGVIKNSYSVSDINGKKEVGGLIGTNSGNLINSFFAGNVYGNSDIGFLVGVNTNLGKIINSYYFDNKLSNLKCIGIEAKGSSKECFTANELDYFKGFVKNKEPFIKWDFEDKWTEVEEDYPLKITK